MKPPGVIGQIITARPQAEQDRLIRARYTYLGDKLTDPALVNQPCDPIRRADGRVLRGRNRNAAVRFADGREVVVLGRHLRLTESAIHEHPRGPCPATAVARDQSERGGDPGTSERRAATVPPTSTWQGSTRLQVTAARLIAPSTDAERETRQR